MPRSPHSSSSSASLAQVKACAGYLLTLSGRRYHGDVLFRYQDGRIVHILTTKADKPETLVMPTGEEFERLLTEVLGG